jgi:peptidoglycan-N-acetylglucosamine deacetylase
MNKILFACLILLLSVTTYSQNKPQIAFTFDDPNSEPTPFLSWQEKNNGILNTLSKYNLKSALFVCGMRVDNENGKIIVGKWNDAGHMICNHSWSHSYFHSKKITLQDYENDFLRCDTLINPYKNFTKLFRFPFLKEGNTKEKRDGFREFLAANGYKTGYVTIDASDWYIDGRMRDTLKADPNADLSPYKQFYLDHIYNRAMYYESLGVLLTGRHIKHTLLLHHNLINSMFLDDLIKMFITNGWEPVNASDAFNDPVSKITPDILPAGESLIWGMAKESGKFEDSLRYPGEDGEYEEAKLNEYLKR